MSNVAPALVKQDITGTEPKARLAWNTRAPILSSEGMEILRLNIFFLGLEELIQRPQGYSAVLHNEPLTAMIYSRVMFDKDIPADLPEHDNFINEVAIPWFNQHGVTVEVVQSKKNFVDDFFYHKKGTRSKNCGKYSGFSNGRKTGMRNKDSVESRPDTEVSSKTP